MRHAVTGNPSAWCFALALLAACGEPASRPDEPVPATAKPIAAPEATYRGVASCVPCHAEQVERWTGSHHDLAMQDADEDSVLGDFEDAVFEHREERFEFSRRDDRFWIRTAGADGETRDFEVTHTFGVDPLQQYLVRRPGGRLHAVAAAWDARPAAAGGQRWFHLQPDEAIPPGDALHWTGLAGSWNAMCAECHSTNLDTGYRLETDAYEPSWSELDVACEACHGPASNHIAWAESGASPEGDPRLSVDLPSASAREWRFTEGTPIAYRVPPAAGHVEIETCAPCHSRRSRIASSPAPGAPFLDGYRPALLEPDLYFADGQIRDEVYVWGSFVQSRMYAAGVTCSDCHDPHSLDVGAPDAACGGCHRSEVFATPDHHHHAVDSPGSSCVACHMPARTYMGVDDRRDHGFRVPRPDLSAAIGVPNACTTCHADRDTRWAADAARRWYGESRPTTPHFAEVLHAARQGGPNAADELAALVGDSSQPGIVRATALEWLGAQPDANPATVFAALEDTDALVRMAAVATMERVPPEDRVVSLVPLLRDPVRGVRIEAARVLAPLAERVTSAAARDDLRKALAEYRAAQSAAADRPESHTNLGILHIQQGDFEAARRSYEAAIRVGPFFVPAYVNLAEVHRLQGREEQAEQVLREAALRAPELAEIHHALGLSMVRSGRADEAMGSLERAAKLAPEAARFAYVYGIALSSTGETDRAIEVLADAQRIHPRDTELLQALATLNRDAGRREDALSWARRLQALRPGDAAAVGLVRELEQRAP